MNAADASVPGAQSFEHVYAAPAEAHAVMNSVRTSRPPPEEVAGGLLRGP